MATTEKVDVGTKDVEINVRRVTALMSVNMTADHPAQVSKVGRELVDKAIGRSIDIDGFAPATRDIPAALTGPNGEDLGERTVRAITGWTPNKESQVYFSVTMRPENQEAFEDFSARLYKATDKHDAVTIISVREGS